MKLFQTSSLLALAALLAGGRAFAAEAPAPASGAQLSEVIVTAQKRSTNLQTTPIAISAVSGATLEKNKILTFQDLAHSVTSLSYSQNNQLRQEYNIRGAVNTRLGSPTADQSVGLFSDGVYVSRSGILNPAFYDVGQVEIIRGPQGVLLGRNVAGGAISVTSAPPAQAFGAGATVGYGNFGAIHSDGYVTGPIAPGLTGRLSFETDDHDGYSHDLLHNVALEDGHSYGFRGQLLWAPEGTDFRAHLTADFNSERNAGQCAIAVPDYTNGDNNGPNLYPWSTERSLVAAATGHTMTNRECMPVWPTFKGDASGTPQGERHQNLSVILNMEKGLPGSMKVTSVTGFREGHSYMLYDQSGIGPDNPYVSNLALAVASPAAFSFPVQFRENVQQISQEIRIQSDYANSPLEWIAGAYFEQDIANQKNHWWAQNVVSAFVIPSETTPTGNPLAAIEGEDYWHDHGGTQTYAFFAQAGYAFTSQWKLTAGVRWTHDHKGGDVSANVISYGDKFDGFENFTPLTTLIGCGGIGSTPVCAPGSAGYPNYKTSYGHDWSAWTPQATLQYTPFKGLMAYFTVGKGFKGGGFENDTTEAGALVPYQPETDTNYEVGAKTRFWDGRAQLNVALYYTNYDNLQVEQTSDACLCNIVNNAGNAVFKGFEGEFEVKPVSWLRLWASGNLSNAKYVTFVDANGNVDSGKNAQRTPAYTWVIGGEASHDAFGVPDAVTLRLSYREQGKLYWDPANQTSERPYGLLDGRLSLTLPTQGRNWTVSVWGKNLTDTQYRTNIIFFFGDEVSNYAPPRTFGGEISARF